MASPVSYYDRLAASVGRIARHSYYPGIEQALDQCLEDVETLRADDRITAEQREALRLIILGVALHAA